LIEIDTNLVVRVQRPSDAINTCAKSAKILQSCDSFASASVERATLPRNPRWYSLPCTECRHASMSRKLSR
jgi:hypothetical protein